MAVGGFGILDHYNRAGADKAAQHRVFANCQTMYRLHTTKKCASINSLLLNTGKRWLIHVGSCENKDDKQDVTNIAGICTLTSRAKIDVTRFYQSLEKCLAPRMTSLQAYVALPPDMRADLLEKDLLATEDHSNVEDYTLKPTLRRSTHGPTMQIFAMATETTGLPK